MYGEQLSALGLTSKTVMMIGKRTVRQATAKGAASASLPGLVHVPAQVSVLTWSKGSVRGASPRYRWRRGVCPALQGSQVSCSRDQSGPSLRSNPALRGCCCACELACVVAGMQPGQVGPRGLQLEPLAVQVGAKIQEHLSAQYPGTAQRFATKPLHALKAGPAGTYPSEASWCLDAGRISLKNTKACWACQQEHTEQRCEATEGRSAAHRALSACFKAGANTGLKGWCTQQLCPL